MTPVRSDVVRTDGSFAEFLAHPQVVERCELGGRVGFMAFHAGLEEGTEEIAAEAAERSSSSIYVARQPPDLQWHVSSHRVIAADSARLAEFFEHVDVVIAVHGYGRPELMRSLLLGGRRRRAAEVVAVHLIRALPGYDIVHRLDDMPKALRGLRETNPVNVARLDGLQIELPPRLRMELPEYARHLVPEQRRARRHLIGALATAAQRLEAELCRPTPVTTGGDARAPITTGR